MFDDLHAEMQAHALAVWPEEACGLVLQAQHGPARGQTLYLPCQNVSPTPRETFRISPELMAESWDKVLAVFHSHTDLDSEAPSKADMQAQIDSALPWGLCATDGKSATKPYFWGPGVAIPPLIGRGFRHGPSGSDGRGDCWALCSDFYKQAFALEIAEVPRSPNWWLDTREDLCRQAYAERGFSIVHTGSDFPGDDVAVGDLFFIATSGRVPHHCAVYQGNGLILTHWGSDGRDARRERRSIAEPLTRWRRYVTHQLRHERFFDDAAPAP